MIQTNLNRPLDLVLVIFPQTPLRKLAMCLICFLLRQCSQPHERNAISKTNRWQVYNDLKILSAFSFSLTLSRKQSVNN